MTTIESLETLEQAINGRDEVLLVFKSDQCIDCDFLDTYIATIENQFPTIAFIEIKRHQLPEVFNHYRIYGVPSFFYYHKSAIVKRYVDKKRKYPEALIAFIDSARKGAGLNVL